MKKIDGIYLQIKTTLGKPENRKKIAWGTIFGVVMGIFITLLVNLSSPPKKTQASLTTKGSTNHFDQKSGPSFILKANGKIKAEVFQKGAPQDLIPTITPTKKDEFEIDLNQSQFTAGKYDLKVTVTNKDEEKVLDQEFTWGVLAINTDKSIYFPGDKAYLQMAALKDDGHTICDGDLALEVTNPKGEIQKFTTKDGTIQKSGTCLMPHEITNIPDYFSYYETTSSGNYQLKLINLANGYEITDSFQVQKAVAFVVERTGPTRIYPPADYKMALDIKANENYQGPVTEEIPRSFELKTENLATQDIGIDLTQITWQADWQKGQQYQLEYIFNAPDISPQFYLLGPLKIGSFSESRRWQIAADDAHTSNGTGGGTWATGSTWVGGVAPLTTDDATIAAGDTVNIGTSTTIANLTINSTGILTHSSNRTLGVTANYTNNGTHTTGSGAITLSGSGATVSGTGSVGGTGNFVFSTAKSIAAGTNLTIAQTTAITAAVTITNNGSITGVALTGSAAGSTWSNASGSTLKMSGAVLATGTLTPAAAANTVEYSGAAQTIKAPTTNPYWHLILSGSGTDVMPAGVTTTAGNFTVSGTVTTSLAANLNPVSGNFTLSGTQLTIGAYTTLVTGTSTISGGTLVISSTTGTKTFVGKVTISGSAVWNNSGGEAISFRNGLENNSSGAHTWGAGIYTFDTNDQSITGSNSISIPSITSGTAAKTVTNSMTSPATLTITTALAGAGNFTNGASATLNLNFTGALTLAGTFTATAASNTVSYGFAGDQTVKNGTGYYNLILANSGAKTMTNITAISGDMTISGAATMIDNGALAITGALNYSSSGSTTLKAATNISMAVFNQTGGTIVDNAVTITVSGTANPTWTESATFTATGTVDFTAGAGTQYLNSGGTGAGKIFNNLTHSGAGTLQLITSDINIDGNFNNSGGTFDTNGRAQSYAGNFANSAIFTAGSTTATFDAASPTTQTLNSGGTGTNYLFFGLTHSGTGTLQLVTSDLDVDGTFTNSAGTFDDGTNNKNMTFAGAWNNTGTATFTRGSGSMTFDGTSTVTNSSSNVPNLGAVTITGTATLGSDITMTSNTGAGTLNLGAGSYTLTLTGTGSPLGVTTFQKGTGSTVLYTGTTTGTNIATVAYNNLTLTPTADTNYLLTGHLTSTNALTGVFTINNHALVDTVNGSNYGITTTQLTINTGGSINARNSTITLTGSTIPFNRAGGTFTAGGSTLVFNADAAITSLFYATSSPTHTVYNVTLSPPVGSGYTYALCSAACTLNIGGAFDIKPDTGSNLLTVDATNSALTVTGTTTIERANSATSKLQTGAGQTDTFGAFTISAGGTYAPGSGAITNISGNYSNAGTFTSNSDTVVLNSSSNQSVTTGSSSFYNLTCANNSSSPGITFVDGTSVSHLFKDITASSVLTFTAGTTSALNDIQLNGGDVGTRIVIRSTTTSQANWNVTKTAPQADVSYVDVSYNNANSGAEIDASNGTNHNGLNNDHWKFTSNQPPNTPTSLTQGKTSGANDISESAWTDVNQPWFGFVVTDPDAGNTVKYQIQVDNTDSNFTHLVLDYTYGSLSASGTTFAYQVGQAGGTYAVGSVSMTLADSATGYWWRVYGIDNNGVSSLSPAYFGTQATVDLKVDATAPTGGSVVNDTNTGSLTQLSATWSGFDASVSGLLKYQYAVGTTAGGSDIKAWTDNSPLTQESAIATGLNLQTSVDYYFSVKAFDNAGNTDNAVSASAQKVTPTLSFTLGSTSITFDNLNASNSYHPPTKNHTLGVTTNAANGYVIYGFTTQLLASLQYPSKHIDNYGSDWDNPTTWSGYGFGYTSSDPDVQGSNRFGSGTKYCAFQQSPPGNIAADNTGPTGGDSWTITYQVATTNVQEASAYQTTAIYIVVPNF